MWLGLSQLAIWLGTALHNFYGGARLLVLPAHAGLKFGAGHPHLSAMLASPAGYFSTGTLGDLLYRPTALSDYFLFYRIGSLSGLDALFLAGMGVYLHRTLGRRPAGTFTPIASRALGIVGLASGLMYVLTMAFNGLANEVFMTKTQHLFTLSGQSGANMLYVVLGLGLGLCSRYFRQNQQLPPASALTI